MPNAKRVAAKQTSASAAKTGLKDASREVPKGLAMHVSREYAEGLSREQVLSRISADGIMGNAATMNAWLSATHGELSLTESDAMLRRLGAAVNTGDFKGPEQLLVAQAAALNAMFGELSRRAMLAHQREFVDLTDRYLRLALKAQGQCRATIETVAAMKNGPTVFARQANINNGGQQQVNNGAAPAAAPMPARTEQGEVEQSKLLRQQHGEQVDTRATSKASSAHPRLAAVGTVNRPAQRRG
jgi:hypothetical protein